MADENPKVLETEIPITPSETPIAAQPTQGITRPSVRKTSPKRGRPRKAANSLLTTTTSLTRTTRRVARSKVVPKVAPVASKMTLLNRLVNFSVVAAVFVTALAIQRIVPTEPVSTPKVEALPVQVTPVVSKPEAAAAAPQAPAVAATPTPTPAAAPAVTPAAAPAAEAPKATDCNPPVAAIPKPVVTPQQIAKRPRWAPSRAVNNRQDNTTPLNAGGTEDLDSEAARQAYMAKSKLATRTPTK